MDRGCVRTQLYDFLFSVKEGGGGGGGGGGMGQGIESPRFRRNVKTERGLDWFWFRFDLF